MPGDEPSAKPPPSRQPAARAAAPSLTMGPTVLRYSGMCGRLPAAIGERLGAVRTERADGFSLSDCTGAAPPRVKRFGDAVVRQAVISA